MSADIINPADQVDAVATALNDVVARQLGVMLSAEDADTLISGLQRQGFVLVNERDLESVLASTDSPDSAESRQTKQIHVHVNLPETMSQKAVEDILRSL